RLDLGTHSRHGPHRPSRTIPAFRVGAGARVHRARRHLHRYHTVADHPGGLALPAQALGLGTAAAFVCNYWLIARIGPVPASLAFYLIPVVAVLTGLLVRHERLSSHELAGCAIVVGALGILYLWNKRQAAAVATPRPELVSQAAE